VLAVIAFDAAGIEVVEQMLGEGRLPNLAAARERGRWTALETPATHFVAGTYPSLYSGLEVGDHGLYFPFQWSPWQQRIVFSQDLPQPEAVWERLTRSGRRSLVVDPYQSPPPEEHSGLAVSGWQFDNRVVLRRWSSPEEARKELDRRHGKPPTVGEVFGRPTVPGLLKMRESLLVGPARAAALAEHALAREVFDLVWVTFTPAHLAGHWFWDLSPLDDGEGEESERRKLEGALAEVYAEVDAALGRTLAALPPEADVIVLSPAGMTHNTSRADLLPDMLAAVLGSGDAQRPDEPADDEVHGAGRTLWRVRAAVPADLRTRVGRLLPDRVALELTTRMELRGVDWAQTRAFSPPGDYHGHVRLNVRGREREGIVDPADVEALVGEIVSGLASFVDPDGAPSVAGVDRTADVVGGAAALGQLPDLVVRWSDRAAVRLPFVTSERFGTVNRLGSGSGRSGNHTGEAWAVLMPGAGSVAETSRSPSVIDVAATACHLLAPGEHVLPGQSLFEAD